jgi:hypothetical protein
MRRYCIWGSAFLFALSAFASGQDKAPRKAARLINDSDLYCSFLAAANVPRLRIKAAERMGERSFLVQGDLFDFDRFPGDGLAVGQPLNILEVGEKVKIAASGGPAPTVLFQRGQARIAFLDANSGRARIERTCGPVEIGHALVPFSEQAELLGIDRGFASTERKEDAPQGRIVFFGTGVLQAGPGQWALAEVGTGQGIGIGEQLTVFRMDSKNAVWQGVANVIVIHAGPRVSTVKILSARDAVQIGDVVQAK